MILSKRLREKYAEEMTIVLQHRFWDLFVNENRFEVKLTFDGIPERLVVPFKAIRVFFDPSVRYGLQFETQPLAGVEMDTNDELIASDFDDPFAHREFESSGSGGDGESREIGPRPATALAQRRSRSSIGQKDRDASSESLPDAELEVDDDRAAQRSGGAEIVSLDAFRKK